MNALELINIGSSKLKIKQIGSHKLDSEILLSKVLNKRREEMLVNLDQMIMPEKISAFNKLINRRSNNEPIAYIIKEKEFWSKLFFVNKDTLIPRPETELMVEHIVKMFKEKSISILDIGTGSGCILISLISELRYSRGIGIDISKKALSVAEKNAKYYKLENQIRFLNKSFEDLKNCKFDLIVSNPPYIETQAIENLDDDIKNFEPIMALDGGNDGLDVIRKVIYKSQSILKNNGTLALEIGNEQYIKVSKILKKNNFKILKYIKDYKENIRCLISKLIR